MALIPRKARVASPSDLANQLNDAADVRRSVIDTAEENYAAVREDVLAQAVGRTNELQALRNEIDADIAQLRELVEIEKQVD